MNSWSKDLKVLLKTQGNNNIIVLLENNLNNFSVRYLRF